MKENKKVRKQKNTLSAKKATKKKRKHALDQESDQEKKEQTITVKKKRKKTRSRPRKQPRKKGKTFLFSLINSHLRGRCRCSFMQSETDTITHSKKIIHNERMKNKLVMPIMGYFSIRQLPYVLHAITCK